MKIEPDIASRYLEQAAIEQVSKELRNSGFEVERGVLIDGLRADLIARRGSETVVFEFKVPGSPDSADWAEQTARLRDYARSLGARFRLVLVSPPQPVDIEIDGFERSLADAMRAQMPPELNALSAAATVREISEVAVASLAIHEDTIDIAGSGAVSVDLGPDGVESPIAAETLPFTFEAVLDRQNRELRLRCVSVETE